MIAQNSRSACAHAAAGKVTKQKQIGLALLKHERATRQELELMTGIPINVVTPRVVELTERGYIEHVADIGSPPRGVLALTDKGREWAEGKQ